MSPSGLALAFVRRLEEMLEEPLRRIEEVARDEELLRLTIVDFPDAISIEVEKDGARVAEEDGSRGGRERPQSLVVAASCARAAG